MKSQADDKADDIVVISSLRVMRIHNSQYTFSRRNKKKNLSGLCNLLSWAMNWWEKIFLLYPRHTKYVGVYSFRFSVRPSVRSYVCSFVRSFIRSSFPHRVKVFVKVFKTSYFEDPVMDLVHIWHDGRYRSKIFISTIPIPGVALGLRSRT